MRHPTAADLVEPALSGADCVKPAAQRKSSWPPSAERCLDPAVGRGNHRLDARSRGLPAAVNAGVAGVACMLRNQHRNQTNNSRQFCVSLQCTRDKQVCYVVMSLCLVHWLHRPLLARSSLCDRLCLCSRRLPPYPRPYPPLQPRPQDHPPQQGRLSKAMCPVS